MDHHATNLGQVDFVAWITRLLTWDGVLPVGVFFAPVLVEALLPNRRGAIEIAAVSIPIIAFLARAVAGSRHIAQNDCSEWTRKFQYGAFFLAIVLLVFFEAFMILSHIMPQGAPAAANSDAIIWSIIACTYLLLMAFGMYPGRAQRLPEAFRPEAK